MDSIIMSIRPEWSAKILNGEKTDEIRKNLGKLEPPFKVYAYVTKGKPYLLRETTYFSRMDGSHWEETKVNSYDKLNLKYAPFFSDTKPLLNGKVCYEFVCDRVDKLEIYDDGCVFIRNQEQCTQGELIGGSCLTIDQMYDYIGYGDDNSVGDESAVGYSLHISQLKIYDKPKELGEFYYYKGYTQAELRQYNHLALDVSCMTRAPQSWQFVEEKQDE